MTNKELSEWMVKSVEEHGVIEVKVYIEEVDQSYDILKECTRYDEDSKTLLIFP